MGLIRAAVLMDYPVVARRLGLDPTVELRAVGLSLAAIEQPQHLISSDAMVRLLEDSAARTGCPSVGLQLAEMRKLSHFGVVVCLLAHQRTLRDVVQMGLQYLTVMNPSVALHLEDTGKIAVLHHVFLTDQPMPASQVDGAAGRGHSQAVSRDRRQGLAPEPGSIHTPGTGFGGRTSSIFRLQACLRCRIKQHYVSERRPRSRQSVRRPDDGGLCAISHRCGAGTVFWFAGR